ncbi:7860_t:CDS:2, partial [Dentiscutata heterogama]
MIFEIDESFHSEEETCSCSINCRILHIRGLKFEVDIVKVLRSIDAKVIHRVKKLKTHHSHRCSVIDELLGVLTRTKQPKETISIVVGPTMGNFTPSTITTVLEIAKLPELSELLKPLEQLPTYPIIVTDVDRLPKYLINV